MFGITYAYCARILKLQAAPHQNTLGRQVSRKAVCVYIYIYIYTYIYIYIYMHMLA